MPRESESSRKSWLVLAAGADREHGGNDGYDDEPAEHYSWDDSVANHAGPQAGDALVLWDKRLLLGASVIEHVETGTASTGSDTSGAFGNA